MPDTRSRSVQGPVGATASGFPVSVQAVGRYADEATLFRLSGQLEQAMRWIDWRPTFLT
ncbi:MAG: hypothetical protein GKS02_03330 [Alphaproteobacteria bacterium]|nr:hypothetical protein [Alphaproteobacteria bacterium]